MLFRRADGLPCPFFRPLDALSAIRTQAPKIRGILKRKKRKGRPPLNHREATEFIFGTQPPASALEYDALPTRQCRSARAP